LRKALIINNGTKSCEGEAKNKVRRR